MVTNLDSIKDVNVSRGVYFLANNKVFEQVVAFLRSFRTHNPEIPLCLIPFDGHFDEIAVLKDAYAFSIFDNAALLADCDAISEQFHGFVVGTYRKLVAWEGSFDEFIYIDVDTVVTESVSFSFDYLEHGDYVASHSNLENIRCWVWKDNVYDTNLLTAPQIAYAANTGFFVSRRGILSMKQCMAKLKWALDLKDSMELVCTEQPFLNFLITTSGYTHTSFLQLLMIRVAPDVSLEWWAGTPGGIVQDGKLIDPRDAGVFLVHWAGLWKKDGHSNEGLPYKDLWDYYRCPGVAADIVLPPR